MKHRDRVLAALGHEEPDRCPFQASFTPEFAARLRAELDMEDASVHNPHGGGNAYALERALDQDMILTSVGWANSYYAAEGDYTDEWGVRWRSVEYGTRYGTGRYTEIDGHPLADDDAIDRYAAPDPERPELYVAARSAVESLRDEYWIVGVAVTTIFECAWALRGLERLLLDLVASPDGADAILEIPYRYHLAVAKRLAGLGVDMIWIGDDFGGQKGMIISPASWRRFFKGRMAELISTVKAIRPGLKVAYHSDGDISPIVPELIEIGVDVLNPVQPACMDPERLKREYGDRLAFWGTIDEQRTLPFGSPADVEREVLARLRTVGRGGGLVLAPTHNVQLDTPIDNYLALVKTVTGTSYRSLAATRR